MCRVMRLFVKSILSAQFFFIYAAFLDKNCGHRRVFCHSKQFILRPLAARPLAQKLRNPCPDDLRNWRKFVADIFRPLRYILRLLCR